MPTKRRRTIDKKPKLRCPECNERIHCEPTPEELRLFGQSIRPQHGQLTSCGCCDTVLEYTCDPADLTLKFAPKWRRGLMNELDKEMAESAPTLSEVVQSISDRRPLRLRQNTLDRMGSNSVESRRLPERMQQPITRMDRGTRLKIVGRN
jgi:hypothetical protein